MDALAGTIARVVGPQKEGSSSILEPIDAELAAKVIELEKTVDELLPKLLSYRKEMNSKVERNLDTMFQTRMSSVAVKGKWNQDREEKLVLKIATISEEEAGATLENAKAVQRLYIDLHATMPSILDKAETNLTALKSVPLDELVAEAEARKPAPASPSVEGARKLSESLAKRMRQDRQQLQDM